MVTLRPYKDTDFKAYSETLLQTWPYDKIQDARNSVAAALKRMEGPGNEELWVAEDQGKPAGFMLLEFSEELGREGKSPSAKKVTGLFWIHVTPEFQRKGIAKELLKKAEERGRKVGLGMLFTHAAVKNLPMINFVSTSGFRFEKYLASFWGEGTDDAFLLVKEL